MAFDWPKFLDEYRVPYVDRGPNINRFQIGIKCPLCGSADPSEHMAIHRTAGWWSCRRNRGHGGNTPHRLIQILAKCSAAAASTIVGDQAPARDPDFDFAAQIKKLVAGKATTTEETSTPVSFPPEFHPLINRGMGRRFWDYLKSRHYSDADIEELARIYRLRYATKGSYGYRLIIPVYTEEGLMSWTGRTIGDRTDVRYKSHSVLDYRFLENPPTVMNIHDLLLNEHDLAKEPAKTLVVAEGPFDAMRLDFIGYPHLRATCFFGKTISRRQVAKLLNLAPLYNRKWVLLDADAKMEALGVQSQLERGGFRVRMMEGGKDAAALSHSQINELISSL